MASNAGMSLDSKLSLSTACSSDLHLYQNETADDSLRSFKYSLCEQLDMEVQKLEEMVKCLENLERDLKPRPQYKQTTSGNRQTNGALNYQNDYINIYPDKMDRPQKSGIPVPRKPNRGPAMSVSPSNRYVKSPPPLARKPKIERRDAGLIKITYSENGQPPETLQASVHTGTSELKTADVEYGKSCPESVSVRSTANTFGGQAIIRRIPTPCSKPQQEKSQTKVPSVTMVYKNGNFNDDTEDVLDKPLNSLSEINGISELETYDNIDNNEIPSYEQFLDEAIENTSNTVVDFKTESMPMKIISSKNEHDYSTMDYTILGTITSLKDGGTYKEDNSKEEMSFVLGRPMSPVVAESSLKRCLSPPFDSKGIVVSEVAPSKRVASLKSRPLPPLPPGAKERKLREITNQVGIMCEGCNNCLLELKRQALRQMYPGGETVAVPIESIENFEEKLQISENGYRFTSEGKCEVCDTHVNQLKTEAVSMVQSIQKAQSDNSTPLATNLPSLIGSINLPPSPRKGTSSSGPHMRYRSLKSGPGNYLSKSAPIGIQAQAYLEQNVRSRPSQKRFPQMLVRPGPQDKPMYNKGVDTFQSGGPEGMGQFGRHPGHYPMSGSQFINTPYMQQPMSMQAFHQQQQIQHQLLNQQHPQQFMQQHHFQPQQPTFQQPHQQQLQQQQQFQQQIQQQNFAQQPNFQPQQYQPQQQQHYSPQHQNQHHYSPHHQHLLHHSHSAPGSPIRIQSPPPRISRITSPPPSSPSLSRLSSLSPPPSASPAASFFARAAQKLSKKKKRHHPPEPEPPPFPTKFSETLRLIPPPCPPCLLRSFGLSHPPGVGKVKVVLRIISGGSHGDQSSSFLHIDTRNKQVTVYDPAASGYATNVAHRKAAMAPKMFAFDGVFTPDHAMTEVCAGSLTEIIQGVVAGADGCLFTYGYSKTGKTYTMVGSDHSSQTLGIIPCAIAWLFKVINEQKDQTGARFSVRVSAVEVSGKQEILKDLLAEVAQGTETGMGTAPGVYLREDPISGTQLENQSELRAPTAEQAAYYLDAALHARSQSEDESRSSHLLFTLHVYQYRIEKENKAGLPGVAGGRSRLHLIDLGSASKSKDPSNVALSLSALGNVIMALVNGQRHVPHSWNLSADKPVRDSKIAQLMRDSLGNITCRTCMIAHVSQSVPHYNESLQVIQLAARIQRMKRRKVRGQFSGTSSDDSSTDGSSIRSRPLRGFRMGTLHETSSLSDPDYTSSSEQSCDTVIYIGRNGQSLSDRELTDHEGPPRSVPRTNPRLPRRASGSRSSGDEGSNSDSGRSLYKSKESLFRGHGHVSSPVRDVSVTSNSRHGTPVRSLSRGTTPVRELHTESSSQRATSPPPASFNLPRKGTSRTKTLPSKQDGCYASVNIVDKMARSAGKTKRSNSIEKKEGEQWIDGPGATLYPETKKPTEQWIDGPPAFMVKPESKKLETKMSSEEMWVDGPPEMLVENQMDENQNRTPKLVMPVMSSKKAHVRSLSSSPKHQSPMNSPAIHHRSDKQASKQAWPMIDLKERPGSTVSVESTNSNVAQQGDSRPNSIVAVNGESDEVLKIETQDGKVKPFVRDWVQKHGLGDDEKNLGTMINGDSQDMASQDTSGSYRRPKPHDSRTKNLIPSSSTPKQSPKNSPSTPRKLRSSTPKMTKTQLPGQGSTTKRVTDWLKSVENNQPEETIYMEGIVGKQVVKDNAISTQPDQGFEPLAAHINKTADISSCSSVYPDTSLNDSRTQECTDIDNSAKTDNSVTDCNIADVSFDSSVEMSNSAQNRDSIYELQMDEQLENALIRGSQMCDTDLQDDETFSNDSCAKNSDVDMSEAFVENMETDNDMKKSETIQSIKTLVGEVAEASYQDKSDTVETMCNDGLNEKLDLDPTVRLLSRKPDGASNPNLICETFAEKTNIAALREEFLITNALSSQSQDVSKRSWLKSSTGRSGEGDGQMEDKYSWEKSDTLSPLKTALPTKVCSKCGYSQQNSKPISKMCKDCQKMVALSIKTSHSSLTRRDKDKTKHVLHTSSLSSGSPSGSATMKSSKPKSQSPNHSRLPIFSKNLQVSSKDSKSSRKKEKESKKANSRTVRNHDSDSGNDSGIVSMEKTLLSPYATVTKPRTVSHSSSGHGSDNSSTMSTDLISKQGSSTSDKQHGGTSSGYESMLRDSEGSGSSTAQEESANELSSGDKKKGSKKKRLPSTRRSRSVPARSSESPESSSRKSSPSSKISRLSPSSTARLEKHGKLKEEPLEIKEYDAEDVKRMNRLRSDEDTLRKNHDKLKEIMNSKQEQEILKGKDQYIVERGNWSFDCKFLMCFSCRSRKKTDV